MRSFGDMAQELNRSTVYLSGLQKRFELPTFEGAAHSDAYVAFLRTVINLRTFDISEESRERFDQFFTRLDPIRDLRNHIAHGHLLVRQDEATKKLVMTLALPKNLDAAYSPDSRHLGFEELERELSRLTELVEEFKQFTAFKSSPRGG